MILVQHSCGPALEFNRRFGHVTKAWAKRHGLQYFFSARQHVPERSPHWEKTLLLEELLNTQDEDLFWLDTDAIPVRDAFPVEEWHEWSDLALCADKAPTPFNTGMMFIRNNNAMREFFRDVNLLGPIPNMRYHDQARICERMPYHNIKVQMLPLRWNFAGCTDWAHQKCYDPIIVAYHGWPKIRALEELSKLVDPPPLQEKGVPKKLRDRLAKIVKITDEQTVEEIFQHLLKKSPSFELVGLTFQIVNTGEMLHLWTRLNGDKTLICSFQPCELEGS